MTGPVEHAVRFGGQGELIGILTEPVCCQTPQKPCVVFINAGMVHRVGPNRLYVNLARHLAAQGFASVRFDVSGIGDSQHRGDGVPADESAVQETSQVMTSLQTALGFGSFILVGLCSGAVTAFRTAVRDERVVGGVLLNPQGFVADQTWNAEMAERSQSRRYGRALFRLESWRRALSGRIDYRTLLHVVLRRLLRSRKRGEAASSIAQQLAAGFSAVTGRGVRMLVVCSEGDLSIDYMHAILGRDAGRDGDAGALALRVFARSDHSLTLRSSQRALFGLLDGWTASFGR